MKYLQMKRNNEEIAQLKAAGKLSEYLKTLHNNMAFHLEIILNQYERTTKIADYRKALAEYCEGEVLETCVGTSRNGKYYPAGTNITFIDWSPNMIEVAISKSYPFIKPKFVIDDVKAMPFPDDSFDTVIDTFGLEYVDEPQKALKEIKRVCKPDGHILLLEHGMPTLPETYSWYNFKMASELKTGGYFCNRHWQNIVAQEQFEILRHERKINGTIYFFILKNNKNQRTA